MKKEKYSKLWEKDIQLEELIEQFTIGHDQELDMHLAEFDIIGSLAHIIMLQDVGLLTEEDLTVLKKGLLDIYNEIKLGEFKIDHGVEDIHSQVELTLTERLGESGKKIHSGRSRNDQILLDMRLFIRNHIKASVEEITLLFNELIGLSDRYKSIGMPGYTHTQAAMPSSFGLWFAAFAESLVDDMIQLMAAYKIINKNPLGSAAGYGSSFPLDRKRTTELLGFDELNYNAIYAQMGRGKSERIVSQAIASLADTISRMANDIILYSSQNFNFISFPDNLTTGSSIMPHKKNPDVFEIIRAKCNRLKALPNEITIITGNLTTGYHRDLQLIKESFMPALIEIRDCIQILHFTLQKIEVRTDILDEKKYSLLYSVEEVNRLVSEGMPFRDAYQKIGADIKSGKFEKPENLRHTHEGSIGNLCNDKIKAVMEKVVEKFDFNKVDEAIEKLLAL